MIKGCEWEESFPENIPSKMQRPRLKDMASSSETEGASKVEAWKVLLKRGGGGYIGPVALARVLSFIKSHGNLYMHVHRSIIHISAPKWKQPMSIN